MPSCSRKKTTERSCVAVVPVRPPCAAGFVLGWREGLVPGNSAIGSDHSPLRSRPAKRVRRRVRIAGESGCRVAAAASNGCRRRRARSEILAHFGAIGLLRRATAALQSRTRRADKLHKTRRFFARRGICGAFGGQSPAQLSSVSRASRAPGDAGRDGDRAEFFCDRLLTAEKTVIRFRPSRRYLRTRVSRTTATSSSTTQPSARTVSKVDAGTVSSAKPVSRTEHADLHRLAMRVFYCRPSAAGRRSMLPQEPARARAGLPPRSVPARLARRRLIAGPTPAMSFCTGLQYP